MPRNTRPPSGDSGTYPLTPLRLSAARVSHYADRSAFGSFIISTTLDKPDPKTRKFIRSYVMRGKNRRRPQRRSSVGHESPCSPGRSGSRLPPPSDSTDRDPWVLVPASKFFSEFSLLGFGDELKPYMKDLIYRGGSPVSMFGSHPALTASQPSPS